MNTLAHVLRKQGLAGDAAATVPVLHYGTAPTCYAGAIARDPAFRRGDLDRALYTERSVVRARCMRGSSYVVPTVDAATLMTACPADGPAERRRQSTSLGLDQAAFDALCERVEMALGDAVLTVAEIREALGPDSGCGGDAVRLAVARLSRAWRVVRAEVRGGWRSDSYRYARWEPWTGTPAPTPLDDVVAARAHVARIALRAYGPMTAADVAWWAGWGKGDSAAALDALGDEVAAVGGDSLILADERDPLASGAADARGVRLLPVWDAWLMGYRDRTRLIADADVPRVYDKAGNATSTLLVDGRVRGVWELAAGEDPIRVRVAPFGCVSWKAVEAAAQRLADGLAVTLEDVERHPLTEPLSAPGVSRQAFLAPIRHTTPAS